MVDFVDFPKTEGYMNNDLIIGSTMLGYARMYADKDQYGNRVSLLDVNLRTYRLVHLNHGGVAQSSDFRKHTIYSAPRKYIKVSTFYPTDYRDSSFIEIGPYKLFWEHRNKLNVTDSKSMPMRKSFKKYGPYLYQNVWLVSLLVLNLYSENEELWTVKHRDDDEG